MALEVVWSMVMVLGMGRIEVVLQREGGSSIILDVCCIIDAPQKYRAKAAMMMSDSYLACFHAHFTRSSTPSQAPPTP